MLDFQRRADRQKETVVQLSMGVCHKIGYPTDPQVNIVTILYPMP